MHSERTQRQIDRLLDEAEEAIRQLDWPTVLARVAAVLAMDPDNQDALSYQAAAGRGGHAAPVPAVAGSQAPDVHPDPVPLQPTSFGNGRYEVKRFLGEGGK